MLNQSILKDPNLLDCIIKATEYHGIIGNEKSKKHILLAGVSTLNLNPDFTLSVIVEGPAGIGKSSLVKSVLSVFPDEKVFRRSRISPRAFDHLEEPLDRKIVFIEEQAGNQGLYSTKLLISEHELKVEVTGNEKNNHKSQTKVVSAVGTSYITTTTERAFDRELESRIIRIYPENSGDYICEVFDSILDNVTAPHRKSLVSENEISTYKEAFPALKPYFVVIPYAKDLFSYDELKTVPNTLRNLKKILGVIEVHALLYQQQREIVNDRVIANENDYLNIKDLLEELVNPPTPERLKLELTFGESEFTVIDIQKIYEYRSDSMAYNKLNKLKEDGIVRGISKGKYVINKIVLPEFPSFPAIPLIPTVQRSMKQVSSNSTNSDNSNHSDDSNDSKSANPHIHKASESLESLENESEGKIKNKIGNKDNYIQDWLLEI